MAASAEQVVEVCWKEKRRTVFGLCPQSKSESESIREEGTRFDGAAGAGWDDPLARFDYRYVALCSAAAAR